jgi:hypothetical protein
MQPEQLPEDNNVELEALNQQAIESNEKLDGIEANTGASALKLDEVSSNTEANVLATSKLQDPLERIAKQTENTETTFNIGNRVDGDDVEFNENQAGNLLWQMLRGPKGRPGERGEKGEKGDTGADSTVPGPVGERGEKGETGERGERGETGKTGPRGPRGPAGADGKDGKDGRDGRDADEVSLSLTITENVTKVVKEESDKEFERIKKHVASKTYSVSQLEGMADATTGQVPTKQADGSWAPATPSGGGSGGTVDSVVAGTGISVDSTDPANPIVSATGGGGGITRSVSTISTPTTAGATALTDYVYFISNTTLTLPTAVSNTNRYTVKCLSGTCVVDGDGTETIDGTATIGIQVEDSVDLISNNTEWKVV